MVQIIKVEKNGDIKLDNIENISELYKKCGFRKADGFENIYTWKNININIELWGRATGKASLKNTYVFPTPIEKTVYGNCVLVGKNNLDYIDINEQIWKSVEENNIPSTTLDIIETKMDISSTNELASFSSLSFTNSKKYDVDNDSDTLSSFTDNDDNTDSELKEESYLYSSEEGE